MDTTNAISLPLMTCRRCGYSWHPRKPALPVRCARCRSCYWNKDKRPRKEK